MWARPTRDASGNALYSQTNANGTVVTTTATQNPLTGAANTALGTTIGPYQEFFYGDTPRPRGSDTASGRSPLILIA